MYRNFFEEERRNDTVLHNYIYNNKYKNMPVDSGTSTASTLHFEQQNRRVNSRAKARRLPTRGIESIKTDDYSVRSPLI